MRVRVRVYVCMYACVRVEAHVYLCCYIECNFEIPFYFESELLYTYVRIYIYFIMNFPKFLGSQE